jgi:hypothetical protein
MREQIAERPMAPSDLLEVSSGGLLDLMVNCLGSAAGWMAAVTNNERLAMNDRPVLDQLNDIAANHDDRIIINRRAGELTLNFGGDNVQANNFERLVPAFALKRRFCRQRDDRPQRRGKDLRPAGVFVAPQLVCALAPAIETLWFMCLCKRARWRLCE